MLFVAVMDTVPGRAIRLALTDAVNCVGDTTVVVSGVLFHIRTVPLVNPEPFAVSVKAGPAATAVAGERLVRPKEVMVKGSGAGGAGVEDVTPTEAVPTDAMRVAGTAAVSCVVETKAVTSGLPFQVT